MDLVETFKMPLAGGAIIGLAAALFMLLNGRIAGISGIFGGALTFPKNDSLWRWLFIAGLIAGGSIVYSMRPQTFANDVNIGLPLTALAGLLVGFGARLGSGCTSGHGVCGLARFSPRSLVATVTFMSSGALMAFINHHVL